MPEESSSASACSSAEEKPCSSTAAAAAAEGSGDVMEEAKKLIGTGKRHLVMGDVVSAVNVFQHACSILAAKYGDTADECAEAVFLYGKSLLELARMENGVLGNALEGVPEESEEEQQPSSTNIESADNLDAQTRDELRQQVYDAMAEEGRLEAKLKEDSVQGDARAKEEVGDKATVAQEEVKEKVVTLEVKEKIKVAQEVEEKMPGAKEVKEKTAVAQEEASEMPVVDEEVVNETLREVSVKDASEELSEEPPEEEKEDKEANQDPGDGQKIEVDPEAGDGDGAKDGDNDNDDEDEDDDEEEVEDDNNGENKEGGQDNEEDDVGNLQLAWEMLEIAKLIYKRKEGKEEQLMAAEAHLKLGEVGAESGNYPQALEDFQECLAIQLKHLPAHSRLLAETHYQVATTLCYMDQYRQAIEHYNSSIEVIENRLGVLQKAIEAAEGTDGAAAGEKGEMEELKQLLPDIREKVEDAKESLRTASAASQAIQQTLGGASSSTSPFPCENGGPSSSSSSSAPATGFGENSQGTGKECDIGSSSSSSKAVSDISHLVRKKRKPEESPVKDKEAKQAKQEATVNGSGDSSACGEGRDDKSQEPAAQSASVESSA